MGTGAAEEEGTKGKGEKAKEGKIKGINLATREGVTRCSL